MGNFEVVEIRDGGKGHHTIRENVNEKFAYTLAERRIEQLKSRGVFDRKILVRQVVLNGA